MKDKTVSRVSTISEAMRTALYMLWLCRNIPQEFARVYTNAAGELRRIGAPAGFVLVDRYDFGVHRPTADGLIKRGLATLQKHSYSVRVEGVQGEVYNYGNRDTLTLTDDGLSELCVVAGGKRWKPGIGEKYMEKSDWALYAHEKIANSLGYTNNGEDFVPLSAEGATSDTLPVLPGAQVDGTPKVVIANDPEVQKFRDKGDARYVQSLVSHYVSLLLREVGKSADPGEVDGMIEPALLGIYERLRFLEGRVVDLTARLEQYEAATEPMTHFWTPPQPGPIVHAERTLRGNGAPAMDTVSVELRSLGLRRASSDEGGWFCQTSAGRVRVTDAPIPEGV